MRRFSLALAPILLLALAPATAHASFFVGAPFTHGPDPQQVAGGPKVPARSMAKRLPSSWCGVERGTDDTTDETANGGYKEHAIYMVPSDGPDRFGQFASSMQSDAFQASALLETTYGRAIRFDMGTSCGPQYMDISVVRMPQTTAQLAQAANSADGTFNAVTNALNAAGFQTIQSSDTLDQAAQRTRNWVVWLDGPVPADTCGQASIYDDQTRADSNLNNDGGKVAIVFPSGQDAFCSSNAVRHEIGHNLGALQPEAPHAFDGSHCNDAVEDTMCYAGVSPQVANGQRGLFFDYHNDDYWDPPNGPPLPWWTVNLNRFLCPDAQCNVVPGGVEDASPTPPASAPASPACKASPDPRRARTAVVGQACTNPKPRLKMTAKRAGGGRWKVTLRATGSGKAVLAVRCRRTSHAQVRTVLSRRTALPRTIRRKVRCGASAPQARLFVGRGA